MSSASRYVKIAVAVILVVAALGFFLNLNGGSIDPTDREVRVIVTGSMDGPEQPYDIPTIPKGSLVMVKHLSLQQSQQAKHMEAHSLNCQVEDILKRVIKVLKLKIFKNS